MGTFWLVWNENGRIPVVKHPEEAVARKEAERIARLQPGDTFHVMQCICSCRKIDVEWTEHVEIPF